MEKIRLWHIHNQDELDLEKMSKEEQMACIKKVFKSSFKVAGLTDDQITEACEEIVVRGTARKDD